MFYRSSKIIQSIENLKKRKPCITVYPQWVEAFAVYTAVIAQKYPQTIPDLMAYQVLIKEASTLGGARWLSYDREFRERAAAKKLKHWGERDPNLWAKLFSNITPGTHTCHYCGGGRAWYRRVQICCTTSWEQKADVQPSAVAKCS